MGNIFSQAAVNKNLSLSMHMNMAIASGWNRIGLSCGWLPKTGRLVSLPCPASLPFTVNQLDGATGWKLKELHYQSGQPLSVPIHDLQVVVAI